MFEEQTRKVPGAGKKTAVGARLQELGPRFTLRLRSLKAGACDGDGEFEFLPKNGVQHGAKKFFL